MTGTWRAAGRRLLPGVTAALLAVGWLVFGLPQAVADGPSTFANTAAVQIPATGSANQTGPASPYPSAITVSGRTGSVTTVTVTLHGLTHSAGSDIDAMVVAPSGENLVVLSDVGAPSQLVTASNINLTFSDSAAGPVPAVVNLPSGTYQPTNTDDGVDSFPAPAPSPSSQTTLAGAFTGINANGTWQLWVVDDTTGDLGQLAGGWSLTITTATAAAATSTAVVTSGTPSTTGDAVTFTATVSSEGSAVTTGSVQFADGSSSLGSPVDLDGSGRASLTTSALVEGTHLIRATFSGATGFLTSNAALTQRVDNPTVVTGNTFCNTGQLSVPTVGTASPYPSNITVSGLPGTISKVTATLKGLSHQAPIDLDVLLAGPTPSTNLFVMSDAGGQNAVSGVDVTFDDDAAGPVPSPLVSGTYRPTNSDDGSSDAMPTPAPAPSSATALSTFDGMNPNGKWSLWVRDDATGDTGSVSGGWCLTVTSEIATDTTISASPNPSTFGAEVTLIASVIAGGSPVNTGSVQFSDGTTAIGGPVPVNSAGTATLTTDALTVGSHSITAAYSGTGNLGDSSDDLTQVVDPANSRTTLASDTNPSTLGQSVMFTATVASGGTPLTSGSVTFSVDGADLSTVGLGSNGQATITTSALAVGTRTIKATYSGTGTFAGSTDTLEQVVDKAATDTALTSAPNPSTFGDQVTFSASVTAGAAPVTSGSVTFSEAGMAISGCTDRPLGAAGIATCDTTALGGGTHTVTATFSGSGDFSGSSDSLDQVVAPTGSSTSVQATPNASQFGQPVTLSASVTAGATPVTSGSVTFSEGGTALTGCTDRPLDSGPATCDVSSLGVGTHTITATYSGAADYASSSGTVAQTVTKAATTVSVTDEPATSSARGASVTFTATVESAWTSVTEGAVSFSVDGNVVEVATPVDSSGVATFTTSSLTAGSHTVIAEYSGSESFGVSDSNPVTHEVTLVADAGGPYGVAEGGSLTLDASASSPGAEYQWDLNGDGVFGDANGQQPMLSWADLEAIGIDDGPASYNVAVRVMDGPISLDSASTTLVVVNTAPVTVLTGDLLARVGVPFTIKIGADDPSSADMAASFDYTVDWGDGSPVETLTGPADPPVTHIYGAAGQYDALFTATDKDGGQGAPTTVEVLASVQPSASPTPPPTSGSSSVSPTSGSSSVPSQPTTTTPDQDLASTGSPVGPGLILVGVGLLVGGVALVVLGRRRRSASGLHE